MIESWKEIRSRGSWDYFMSMEHTQPEPCRRAWWEKEHLPFKRGACRSTRAVSTEGQIPNAQPWAEQDLFPSSWREGLCVSEMGTVPGSPMHTDSAPAGLPGQPRLLPAWPGGILPRRAALPAPQATYGAQSWHKLPVWPLLQCQGFDGDLGLQLGAANCTGAPARLFRHLLLVFQNLGQEKMLFLCTWLSFLYVNSEGKLLHRNNAI